jgi:hypothetical protein
MRISGLANISTGLLPEPELAAIDALFDAPGDPRRPIDYHGIPVVAHPYGFLATPAWCSMMTSRTKSQRRSG